MLCGSVSDWTDLLDDDDPDELDLERFWTEVLGTCIIKASVRLLSDDSGLKSGGELLDSEGGL